MKVLLALAVLTTSAVTFAAESREIQDIMYLPNAGTTYGFSTGEYISQKQTGKGNNPDSSTKGYGLSQTLGHSITDRLSLQASLGYLSTQTNPEGSPRTDQKGISDPTVQARFRTVDESFRWDIIGGATIGTGDREQDRSGNFNNLQGGSNLFVGTQIGGKSVDFQWAILGQVQRNMKATTKVSGGPTVKDDEYNSLLIRADILNRLAERSFLRTFAAGNFAEDHDNNFNQATASNTRYTVGTEYQHKLSEDLMLRAGVDYNTINKQTAQIDTNNDWRFRFGANYQF